MGFIQIMLLCVFTVLLLLLHPHQSLGLKEGAPAGSCFHMIPKHPKPNTDPEELWEPQTIRSPYSIEVEHLTLAKDQKQVISLKGEAVSGLFRGFLVQVREVGANGTGPVGYFYSCPLKTQPVKCEGVKDSDVNVVAVTHTYGFQSHEVSLEWIAPSSGGKFRVYATFVENKRSFWTLQTSSPFKAEAGSTLETEALCPAPLTAPNNTCALMNSSQVYPWIVFVSLIISLECLLRAISFMLNK